MKKKGKRMIHQLDNLNKEQQDLLEKLLEEINNQKTMPGLKALNEVFLNALMKKERDIYLRRSTGNKGNGFYPRDLMTGMGPIDLTIPRDRLAEFRPFLLPEAWQRGDQSYDDLIASLLIHAYSPNKIRSILKKLGLSYSDSEMDELKEELYQRSIEFKTQQLNDKAFCLYIDAYHTKIKDSDSRKVTKAVIHTVVGIDLDGNKEVYGYYEYFGSENKEHWLMVLNDLIDRGLKKISIIISDDFPGLSSAIEILFPKTDHQLCFIHMQRNVSKQLSKSDAKDFNDTLKTLKTYRDFEKAVCSFEQLCVQYEKKYPSFIDHISQNKENYFLFLKYPQNLRKHIYTTNVSENLNSRLEVMRVNLGGYFQSEKTLQIAMQVLIDKIKRNKWRKPIPAFRDCSYEINQIFNRKFSS
jgi:putative transposase